MSAEQSASTQSEGTSDAAVRGPLFRFDPGWPFVIAGLALIVSAVLIPAQRELHDLEQRLKVHQAFEERSKAEILAYQQFLHDIGAGNERLLERLVRAQLNKMPKDERPLLLMPTANDTVPQWIESSVAVEIPETTPYPDTLLSRIASGPRRLWVLATGAFLVFLGVMFAPTTFSSRRPRSPRVPARSVGSASDVIHDASPLGAVDAATVAAAGAVAVATVAVAAADPVAEAEAGLVDAETEAGAEVADELEEEAEDEVETEADEAEVAEIVSEPVTAELPVAELPSIEAVEPGAAEAEPAMCEIETIAVPVPAPVAHEPETLDSAMGAAEMLEAKDVHELQYGAAEPEFDAGEEVARAETEAIPGEPECVIDVEGDGAEPVELSAHDRALDRASLFEGIREDRWIDTTDRAAR